MQIRIADYIEESIVDGPGIRFVIFLQGCEHHCPECHNPDTHPLNGGFAIDVDELLDRTLNYPLMKGLTISGGEPFLQEEALLALIKGFKLRHPKCDIVAYSGFTFEQLLKRSPLIANEILKEIDYLVDGPYMASLRDLTLKFRGSKNQRIIDIKKTFNKKEIVIADFSD